MKSKKFLPKLATDAASEKQVAHPKRDPKAIRIYAVNVDDAAKEVAQAAASASLSAALVVDAFQSNILGKDVDIAELTADMQAKAAKVSDGDLSTMEAMLVGQATALQTMFTHLAKRTATQEYLKQYQVYMTLALKAQAQSRATISALVDLKYPKQAATFVKQANISAGHQQVNNGAVPAVGSQPHASAGDFQTTQNKLLENINEQRLDFGAQATTSGNHQGVEAVGIVHRS